MFADTADSAGDRNFDRHSHHNSASSGLFDFELSYYLPVDNMVSAAAGDKS